MIALGQAFVLAVALLGGTANGMMPSGFGRKKEPIPAIKSDIKYIKCDVCKHVARVAYRSVGSLRKSQPSWKKLSEEAIMGHLDKLCNPQTEEGEWILHMDIKEQAGALKVVEMTGVCTMQKVTPSLIHKVGNTPHVYQPFACMHTALVHRWRPESA
jgi:hypothetical protein